MSATRYIRKKRKKKCPQQKMSVHKNAKRNVRRKICPQKSQKKMSATIFPPKTQIEMSATRYV